MAVFHAAHRSRPGGMVVVGTPFQASVTGLIGGRINDLIPVPESTGFMPPSRERPGKQG
jgi:hypothetical protein